MATDNGVATPDTPVKCSFPEPSRSQRFIASLVKLNSSRVPLQPDIQRGDGTAFACGGLDDESRNATGATAETDLRPTRPAHTSRTALEFLQQPRAALRGGGGGRGRGGGGGWALPAHRGRMQARCVWRGVTVDFLPGVHPRGAAAELQLAGSLAPSCAGARVSHTRQQIPLRPARLDNAHKHRVISKCEPGLLEFLGVGATFNVRALDSIGRSLKECQRLPTSLHKCVSCLISHLFRPRSLPAGCW
eukprot:SAG22_NODE_1501_length_4280_cov_1.812963_3_plen_247_part_00